jgi:hypothetical protein
MGARGGMNAPDQVNNRLVKGRSLLLKQEDMDKAFGVLENMNRMMMQHLTEKLLLMLQLYSHD